MKKLLFALFAIYAVIISASLIYAGFFTGFLDSARAGNTARVQKLLSKGQDKTSLIKALDYAVSNNRPGTVSLLLDYVKPDDYKAVQGLMLSPSPMSVASQNGYSEILRLLIEKGANVNEDKPLSLAVANERFDAAELLLKSGANPNAVTLGFHPAPDEIPDKRMISLLALMLEKGADIRGDFGLDALGIAIKLKDYDAVNALIEKGAAVHLPEAVSSAALIGDQKMVEYLIQKGADIKNKEGTAALAYVLMYNQTGLFEYLLKKGAPVSNTIILAAVTHNNTQAVSLLIKSGADINGTNGTSIPPLIDAVSYLNPGMVKLLIDSGASVKAKDSADRSALDVLKDIKSEIDWFDMGHKKDYKEILDMLKSSP